MGARYILYSRLQMIGVQVIQYNTNYASLCCKQERESSSVVAEADGILDLLAKGALYVIDV